MLEQFYWFKNVVKEQFSKAQDTLKKGFDKKWIQWTRGVLLKRLNQNFKFIALKIIWGKLGLPQRPVGFNDARKKVEDKIVRLCREMYFKMSELRRLRYPSR